MLAFGWVKIGFKSYRYKMSPTDRQAIRPLFYMFRSEVFCQFSYLRSQISFYPCLVQLLGGKTPPSFEIWRVALFLASTTQIGQQDYCKLTTFQVLSKKCKKLVLTQADIWNLWFLQPLQLWEKFNGAVHSASWLNNRGKYCGVYALPHCHKFWYVAACNEAFSLKGWFDFLSEQKQQKHTHLLSFASSFETVFEHIAE